MGLGSEKTKGLARQTLVWNPAAHLLFPTILQTVVRTVLLLRNRKNGVSLCMMVYTSIRGAIQQWASFLARSLGPNTALSDK